MNGKKSALHQRAVSCVLPLGFAFSMGFATMAVASPLAKGGEDSQQIAQAFQPPPGGVPTSTAGGGTRGACPKDMAIVALMPSNKLGLTFEERPTFFLYVPETVQKPIKFSLVDSDEGEVVYETEVQTPNKKSGIISVQLSENAPSLEVNKMYSWYAEIACDEKDPSANTGVEGWVKRIQPDRELEAKLKEAKSESDRASLYAENGIWYEAVTVALKRLQPEANDAQARADWEALLTSVGLGEIVNEPLIDCCTAPN